MGATVSFVKLKNQQTQGECPSYAECFTHIFAFKPHGNLTSGRMSDPYWSHLQARKLRHRVSDWPRITRLSPWEKALDVTHRI